MGLNYAVILLACTSIVYANPIKDASTTPCDPFKATVDDENTDFPMTMPNTTKGPLDDGSTTKTPSIRSGTTNEEDTTGDPEVSTTPFKTTTRKTKKPTKRTGTKTTKKTKKPSTRSSTTKASTTTEPCDKETTTEDDGLTEKTPSIRSSPTPEEGNTMDSTEMSATTEPCDKETTTDSTEMSTTTEPCDKETTTDSHSMMTTTDKTNTNDGSTAKTPSIRSSTTTKASSTSTTSFKTTTRKTRRTTKKTGTKVPITRSSTTTTKVPTSPTTKKPGVCHPGKKRPYNRNCYRYLECTNHGEWKLRSCNWFKRFDSANLECKFWHAVCAS